MKSAPYMQELNDGTGGFGAWLLPLCIHAGLPAQLPRPKETGEKQANYVFVKTPAYFTTLPSPILDEFLASKFRALADDWYANRPRADVKEMCSHRSYLRIVAMGPIAIRFILQELQRTPDHWFVALALLTDAKDVIPKESYGKLSKMAEAWISWGKANGQL